MSSRIVFATSVPRRLPVMPVSPNTSSPVSKQTAGVDNAHSPSWSGRDRSLPCATQRVDQFLRHARLGCDPSFRQPAAVWYLGQPEYLAFRNGMVVTADDRGVFSVDCLDNQWYFPEVLVREVVSSRPGGDVDDLRSGLDATCSRGNESASLVHSCSGLCGLFRQRRTQYVVRCCRGPRIGQGA